MCAHLRQQPLPIFDIISHELTWMTEKCQGGSPCEYCIRTKKICLPQVIPAAKAQFIISTPDEQALQVVAKVPVQVDTHLDTLYLDYFDLFLKRCQFTADFNNLGADLLPLIQTCLPLRQVIMAIGALEASRQATVKASHWRQSPQIAAFSSYGASIRALQGLLHSPDALHCEGVLWCTLLLGMFEVRSCPHHVLFRLASLITDSAHD